jgi:hypothetical protein
MEPHLADKAGNVLIDSAFWLSRLSAGRKEQSAWEFPILSSDRAVTTQLAVTVVQSDIPGPEGLGYYWGHLAEANPEYYSRPWEENAVHHVAQWRAARLALRMRPPEYRSNMDY